METVLLCALAVGGATAIGAFFGFAFRTQAQKHCAGIISFAAGVMLTAAFSGLIIPAFEGGLYEILMAIAGMFCGGLCIHLTERLIPISYYGKGARSALLLAIAMAIHNFPEGIAAGLSFGTDNTSDAIAVSLGIALHNLPEGMITVFPMLSAGMKPHKAFLLTLSGGAAEVLGTLLGYFASELAAPVLPFTLTFAGGTMLFVVIDELIPDAEVYDRWRAAFLAILGAVTMSTLTALLAR